MANVRRWKCLRRTAQQKSSATAPTVPWCVSAAALFCRCDTCAKRLGNDQGDRASVAKRNAIFQGERFGASGGQQHVRAFFLDVVREANGIADAFNRGESASFESGAVVDGVEQHGRRGSQCAHASIARIVLENDDSRFDGVASAPGS